MKILGSPITPLFTMQNTTTTTRLLKLSLNKTVHISSSSCEVFLNWP